MSVTCPECGAYFIDQRALTAKAENENLRIRLERAESRLYTLLGSELPELPDAMDFMADSRVLAQSVHPGSIALDLTLSIDFLSKMGLAETFKQYRKKMMAKMEAERPSPESVN